MAKQKRRKQEKGKHAKQKIAPVPVTTPRGGVTRRDFVRTGVAGTIAYGALGSGAYDVLKVATQAVMNVAMRTSTTATIVTATVASGVAIMSGTSETLASGQECWRQVGRDYQIHSTGETPEGFWGP